MRSVSNHSEVTPSETAADFCFKSHFLSAPQLRKQGILEKIQDRSEKRNFPADGSHKALVSGLSSSFIVNKLKAN